jgi:hypothetical protein
VALAFETFLTDGFLTEGFLTEGFLGDTFLRAADLPAVVDFFLPEAFRGAAFAAFFVPPRFLVVVFFVDFFAADFFVPFFLPGFRLAAFFRAGFFFDTFLVDDLAADFVFVLLTLRFVPEVFLLAPGLREALLGLPVPARFAFLLADFLAGMVGSCRSEKNAELYIGCLDMEALISGYFGSFRRWWRMARAWHPERLSRCRDNRFVSPITLHYND